MARLAKLRTSLQQAHAAPHLREFVVVRIAEVDELLRHIEQQRMLERVVAACGRHVTRGDFFAARAEIDALPNEPPQLQEIKTNLRTQIAGAEAEWIRLTNENARLRRLLLVRGVSNAAIDNMARANSLDLTNPGAANALLEAIERQVR